MRDIVLDSDGYRPKDAGLTVKLVMDGEKYEAKRPKNTVGAMFDRLRERAEAGDFAAHTELITKVLKAFLVHEEDVDYFLERSLDSDDWVDLDYFLYCLELVTKAFADNDETAKPSAAARRRAVPSDRQPSSKKPVKKSAARRPVKKSAPAS